MNVHVTVDLDGDDPGGGQDGRRRPAVDRLRHEADPLARRRRTRASCAWSPAATSSRPSRRTAGAGEPSCELRTAYAGEPVTRWTGSVADVGGVAASVASTLADLHDVGIVHGRLDASHVLVGDDGRPRLCGWPTPTAPDRPTTSPPGGGSWRTCSPAPRRPAAASEPRPAAPAGSAAGVAGGRRPRHRSGPDAPPSARALADMVMTAVPASRPAAEPPRATRPARRHGPQGDTLDRIWSYAGEPSEDERWAAAFGTAPDDFEPEATRIGRSSQPTRGDLAVDHQLVSRPTDSTTTGPPDLPLAQVEALDWDAPAIDDRRDGRGFADPALLDESFGDAAPDVTEADDDPTRDHVPVGTRPRSLPAAAAAASAPRRGGRLTAVGAAVGRRRPRHGRADRCGDRSRVGGRRRRHPARGGSSGLRDGDPPRGRRRRRRLPRDARRRRRHGRRRRGALDARRAGRPGHRRRLGLRRRGVGRPAPARRPATCSCSRRGPPLDEPVTVTAGRPGRRAAWRSGQSPAARATAVRPPAGRPGGRRQHRRGGPG